MTFRATNVFEVAPANVEEFVALLPEARTIIDKNGGANLRLFQTTVAGPNTGIIRASVEFDSMAAFGAYSDAIAADADFAALTQKAFALGTLTATAVSTELG